MPDKNTSITVGAIAPDFTLKDQNNKDFTLSKQKGKRVLLSFQPMAWTAVCQNQMLALEEHYGSLKDLNTVPVGISIDAQPSKKAWAASMNLKQLKVLADFWPHGAVAKAYGLFREAEGFSQRANVIIDEKGKVAWIKVYDLPEFPDIHEVMDALKKIK
jgi:peroxiredoxin